MKQKSNDFEIDLYMDATGDLTRSPDPTNIETIYSYALIVPIKSYSTDASDPFPLTEMISGSHTQVTIGTLIKKTNSYFKA